MRFGFASQITGVLCPLYNDFFMQEHLLIV